MPESPFFYTLTRLHVYTAQQMSSNLLRLTLPLQPQRISGDQPKIDPLPGSAIPEALWPDNLELAHPVVADIKESALRSWAALRQEKGFAGTPGPDARRLDAQGFQVTNSHLPDERAIDAERQGRGGEGQALAIDIQQARFKIHPALVDELAGVVAVGAWHNIRRVVFRIRAGRRCRLICLGVRWHAGRGLLQMSPFLAGKQEERYKE